MTISLNQPKPEKIRKPKTFNVKAGNSNNQEVKNFKNQNKGYGKQNQVREVVNPGIVIMAKVMQRVQRKLKMTRC